MKNALILAALNFTGMIMLFALVDLTWMQLARGTDSASFLMNPAHMAFTFLAALTVGAATFFRFMRTGRAA